MRAKLYRFDEVVSKTAKIKGILTNEYKTEGDFPVIDQGSKFIAGYSNNKEALYKDTLPVVVFGDHTLSVKYLDFPFCVGADGTQILKPNPEVIVGRFLYYAILNLNIKSLGYSRHLKVLKKATFRIPDINEQHRIVKTLDLAQSLIEKRKQAIAYLDDYIKAVFLDIFGDPVSNPKGWEVVEFEKLVTSIKYGVGSPPQYSEDGYKFIRATDIKKGYIIDSDIKRISPEEANKILKCKLSTNDLIIVRSGVNAGDSAIITKKYDGSFAGYDLIVKLNSLVNPVFIGNLFTSNYLEAEIKPLTRRAAQPHINSDQVKKLKIILPKIEMQKLFAKKVGQIELLKQKMLLQLKELENNFQAELQRAFQSD